MKTCEFVVIEVIEGLGDLDGTSILCGKPAVKSVAYGTGRKQVCQEHYSLLKGVRGF